MNKDTKTALITGSGQNIGRGIAHHLAAAGFNIIAVSYTHLTLPTNREV